jgi:hypothetical protein
MYQLISDVMALQGVNDQPENGEIVDLDVIMQSIHFERHAYCFGKAIKLIILLQSF